MEIYDFHLTFGNAKPTVNLFVIYGIYFVPRKCRGTETSTYKLPSFLLRISEAEAIGSLYAICILGNSVFIPELIIDFIV